MTRALLACAGLGVVLAACDFDADYAAFCAETGRCDAGSASQDGGPADAGAQGDAGSGEDAGSTDAGSTDAGSTDAGSTDAGSADAGGSDAGGADAGGADAGGNDAGGSDAGGSDAGGADAGGTDAGLPYLVVSLSPGKVYPTQCWPFTVTLRNPDGGLYTPGTAPSTFVTLTGGGAGVSDVMLYPAGSCAVALSGPVEFTVSHMAFNAIAMTSGPMQVSASAPGFAPGFSQRDITTASLMITSFEQTLMPGALCSAPVVVELRDGPLPIPFPAATTLQVGVSGLGAGTVSVFANPGCVNDGSIDLPVLAGATSVLMSFSDSAAGTFLITASNPAFGTAGQGNHALEPHLSFTSVPANLTRSTCASAMTIITLSNAAGNPVTTVGSLAVTFDATPPGCAEFRPTCASAPITGITVNGGASGAMFYVKGGSAPGLCGIEAHTTGAFNPGAGYLNIL